MKIQSLPVGLTTSLPIKEKQDGGGGGNSPDFSQEQKRKQQELNQQEASTEVEEEIGTEKVNQAVQSFQKDEQALSQGLSASIEGNGPGLTVVLKDSSGGVIRHFTGPEFVRLRRATSQGGRIPGKILDRKL